MNALIDHVASGRAFFSGLGAIALAWLLSVGTRGRLVRPARTLLVMTGAILCVASATPLPWWAWGVGAAVLTAWLIVEGRERTRARPWVRGAALATLASGVAVEAPYHRTPALPRLGSP